MSGSDRLESWKAIASYLNRSVRTVRRWEEREDLPVHRHRHAKGSSVFAYRSELDAWRDRAPEPVEQAHAEVAVAATTPAPKADTPVKSSLAQWGIAATALLGAGLVGWLVLAPSAAERAAGTAASVRVVPERDAAWVLLIEVDDSAASPVHANSLTRVARQALAQTHQAVPVPNERIARMLNFMRLPAGTPIDPKIGQELAQRDSDISLLAVPRVERIGEHVLMAVDLLAGDGTTLGSASVRGTDEQPDPSERLLLALREAIDATVVRDLPTSAALAPVTTGSLAALRLFTRAQRLLLRDQGDAARAMLRQALSQDELFASAHFALALARENSGQPMAAVLSSAERAAALLKHESLRDHISDAERYYILGGTQRLAGDADAAAASYEALHSLAPRHLAGNLAALALCLDARHAPNCIDYRVRVAETLPLDVDANLQAAKAIASYGADPAAADKYLARASRALARTEPRDLDGAIAIGLFRAHRMWLADDLTGTLAEAEALSAHHEQLQGPLRDELARELSRLYLATGQLDRADEWICLIDDTRLRHEMEAVLLMVRGDREGLRHHLAAGYEYREPFSAVLLAMHGHIDEARGVIDHARARGLAPMQILALEGQLAIATGDQEGGVKMLSDVIQSDATTSGVVIAGLDNLAMQLAAQGRGLEAIDVLSQTNRFKSHAALSGDGSLWLMCQAQLASLYRDLGRDDDAQRTEQAMKRKLGFADESHPLLAQIAVPLASE